MSNSPHPGVLVRFKIAVAFAMIVKLSSAIDLNETMMPDEVLDKSLELFSWKRRRGMACDVYTKIPRCQISQLIVIGNS